jgi:hypothetical protein
MSERRTIWLSSKAARQRAQALIDSAPEGYVVKITAPTRTDEQNKALWGRIKDLREQVPGMAEFTPDDVKNRFMHALGCEMRFLPELDGAGMFPVGFRSSLLTVEQFGALLTLMDEFGARHGVQFQEAA